MLLSQALLFGLAVARPLGVSAATLELKPGDHISLIGNTLANRMQHDGWLETYIYARFRGRICSFATWPWPGMKWPCVRAWRILVRRTIG